MNLARVHKTNARRRRRPSRGLAHTPGTPIFALFRCNQENLIAQLKSGVHALETPLDNLESNWAYMVMASLAWNLKAWFGLSLPEKGRWASKYKIEKRAVIEMELRSER